MIVLLPNSNFYKYDYSRSNIREACGCRCLDYFISFSIGKYAIDVWFDDEYGFTDKPVNKIATVIALLSGCSCYEGTLKGAVCFVACNLETAETVDLSWEQEQMLITTLTFLGGKLICKENVNG